MEGKGRVEEAEINLTAYIYVKRELGLFGCVSGRRWQIVFMCQGGGGTEGGEEYIPSVLG